MYLKKFKPNRDKYNYSFDLEDYYYSYNEDDLWWEYEYDYNEYIYIKSKFDYKVFYRSRRGFGLGLKDPLKIGDLIDMDCIYSKVVKRNKKIDEILGNINTNTLGDIYDRGIFKKFDKE